MQLCMLRVNACVYTFFFSFFVCVRACMCLQDLQRQMVEPSGLPLVERLTQEVQHLRESLVQRDGPPATGPIGRQPGFGGGHQRSMGRCL